MLSLTSKGLKAIGVIKDLGKEIEEIISEFNDEEKGIFEELLMKLSRKLKQKGHVLNAEICKSCCFFKPNKYPRSSKPHYCNCLNIVLGKEDIYKECPEYKDALNW